ncbi:hypothetical protein [Frigoriglobus tundricola]|uniref:Tetratricopeptide repeat protein n=1 Tax=Frigoriglobus tundricola TaxID=2774151 RepID=A0A6M5Z2Y5_9BACT|nr:hypothetical protein [Frigoriglobus tundricola]QJW99873.1 hypothetical protein FTUN_7496 [Frigoriglobus tundricola]
MRPPPGTAPRSPRLVEQGTEQFDAKQYADATRTFLAASQKAPSDAAVRGLLQKAQNARRTEIRDEYEKAMGAGRLAAGAGNHDAAVRWFTSAETLVPGDEAAAAEKLAADFEGHVRRGRDARAANRPAEAVTEFEIAARLMPRDEAVKALLAAARQALTDADRERYKQALAEAKTAMLARRYRDAVKVAQQAEGIVADHAEATQLRRDAERVIAEYDQWVSKAKMAIQRKRFDEAVAAADEAARLMPGEAEPPLLRSEATRKKMDQAGKRK